MTIRRPPPPATRRTAAGIEHGAGADQRALAQSLRQRGNALQRRRRVQRHLDRPEAGCRPGPGRSRPPLPAAPRAGWRSEAMSEMLLQPVIGDVRPRRDEEQTAGAGIVRRRAAAQAGVPRCAQIACGEIRAADDRDLLIRWRLAPGSPAPRAARCRSAARTDRTRAPLAGRSPSRPSVRALNRRLSSPPPPRA